MAVRDYSSIYSIEDWMINQIAPKFYDMDNVSLLNVGQFGMTNHVLGTVIEDQFEVVNRYLNEILPQKANLPDFIYANAALYGIEDFLARPSKSSMLLYIKESDVIKKSVYRNANSTVSTSGGKSSYVEYRDFVIDSDMQIIVDDVQYSIPYNVNIQVSSLNRDGQTDYSYIATWIMDDTNSIAEVTNPYIKIYKASYDDDVWIVLKLDIYQYVRKSYDETILTNSKLNIPYFETTYSDQLCNFEVFYQAPGETTWTQLEKRLESAVPVSTPFIYYKIIDDSTVRFSFANDDRYFVPDYNSSIRVEMYETLGKDGDFNLVDNTGIIPQISLTTKNEEYAYNRSTIVMGLVGADSEGGRTKLSIQDIKDLTCEKVLTINSITTDNDLMMFSKNYAAVYQTNPIFIKYRDDPAGRIYGCYIRLTDGVDIFPTNTPDLLISADDVDSYYPSLRQYMIKPGRRYGYSTDTTNQIIGLIEDDDVVDVDYTSIFLTIIQTKPNSVRYYLNTIDKNVSLEYNYINNFSYYNFLVTSCHINRNAIKGENSYKISITIMRVDGVIEGIDRVDEINDSEDIYKDLKMLIIFDTNEGHYVDMTLVKEDKKLGAYTFQAEIYTDDTISDSRISLTNLINSGSAEEQSRVVDMINPSVHFCVFYRYNEGNITHQYANIEAVKDMTMCNEYIPYDDEFYFAKPMELTRSHVVFEDMPEETSGFGFLIKQVPVFGYNFIMSDDDNVTSAINKISSFHSFISDTLMDVTPNFTINIKFFNTYGRSKMFYIAEDTLLDYVHLKIKLKVKFYAGIDQSAYLSELRSYIKNFVENLNTITEGTNKIEVSVLLHNIHTEFEEQIEYVIFEKFNDYDAGVQVIEISGIVEDETTPETVPEYITLSQDDITIIPL